MATLTMTRLGAMLLTAVFVFTTTDINVYYSIVISFGMAHYFLSLLYARTQLRRLSRDRSTLLPTVLLLAAGVVITVWDADAYYKLVLYFAVHHMFNETYLADSALHLPAEDARMFRFSTAVFHGFLYFAMLNNFEQVQWMEIVSVPMVAVGLALSTVFFAYAVYRVVRMRGLATLGAFLAYEGVGLALAVAALLQLVYINYLDIVFYHFVFWCLHPLPKLLARGGRRAALRYFGETAVFTAVFVALSPLGFIHYDITPTSLFVWHFYLWSFIHITTAFALSSAQPLWIRRWFERPALQGARA